MNLNVKGIILKLTKKKHRRKFQIDNIKIKTFNLQIHHMEWKGHQQEDIYNAYTQ